MTYIISVGFFAVGAVLVFAGVFIGPRYIVSYLAAGAPFDGIAALALLSYLVGFVSLAFGNYFWPRRPPIVTDYRTEEEIEEQKKYRIPDAPEFNEKKLKWVLIRWAIICLGTVPLIAGQLCINFIDTISAKIGDWSAVALIVVLFMIGVMVIGWFSNFFTERASLKMHDDYMRQLDNQAERKTAT